MGRARSAPSLTQLRAFIASLDAGSITGGAVALDLTQSAVSHAITELESSLGVRLLRRHRSGVTATEVGGKVAVHARRMMQLMDALQQDARNDRDALVGRIRIAAFRSAATHLLPSLITSFMRLHPQVSFTVLSLEGVHRGVEQAVLNAQADVGFAPLPVSEELMAWEVARDDWVALCPSSRYAEGGPLSWSELEREPFIMCNEGGSHDVQAFLDQHGARPRIVDQVKDDSVILSMVAHGLGLSSLPRIAVDPVPPGITVRPMPAAFERRIGIVVSPSMFGARAVSTFLKVVREPRTLAQSEVARSGLLRVAATASEASWTI